MSDSDTHQLWAPLVAHGSTWCARNVHATCAWLEVADRRWSVAITEPGQRNCYVVSATGQYFNYALEETRRLPTPLNRLASATGLHAIAPLLRRLDPIVVLDALPVSTVLHQQQPAAAWQQALDAARQAYPGVPIVIRSMDEVQSPDLLTLTVTLGLDVMVSRLVFHQDPRDATFWRIRNVRHDLHLAERSPLPHRQLRATDATAVTALYWQLYGEKHSQLNPRFTAAWIAHGITSGVLHGEGIEYEGRLVAAYLAYQVGDMMTNPVFGYELALPQSLGLYRRLSLLTMLAARARGVRIHASSGAPGFKASRGGVATVEYHAVDLRGVRGTQRLAWQSAIAVARALGPHMLMQAR